MSWSASLLQRVSMSHCLAFLALIIPASAGADESRFALESGLELSYTVKFANWFDGTDGKPDIAREVDGSPTYKKSDLTIYVLGRQPDGSFRVLMQRSWEPGSPLITWADLFLDGRLTLIPSAMPSSNSIQFGPFSRFCRRTKAKKEADGRRSSHARTWECVFPRWTE
jgi:hypothetical protein